LPVPPHFTHVTESLWPDSTCWMPPVFTNQILTVASLLALASRGLPSCHRWYGSHASDVTHFAWPLSGPLPTALPVSGSHILTALSMLPVASLFPSALHSTHSTHPSWPERVYLGVPVMQSHTLAVLSP